MNVVCLGISVEKLCASINLIYQFSSYEIYVLGDNRTFVAQIVLISVQTGIFAAEALTALASSCIFGREVNREQTFTNHISSEFPALLSVGTLFYAVVITGCYVVFELGKWRYNEVPIDVPFFRLGNGPLALAAVIVQLCSVCYPRLVTVSVILQIIVASLALFTLSPAITNVYFLVSCSTMTPFLSVSLAKEDESVSPHPVC
ncbi:hypothetical protein OESDEN_05663 [Oesophagostomum dentatum]|uniref:Uncharacterized protein n=1 Tax=Oesophagostomum dentatum TaxID=61180 RepID=A0A0B1TE55_OESDE|nr:hypothetical protein OESDEN_05663 [Oesophagostomum dentatum]